MKKYWITFCLVTVSCQALAEDKAALLNRLVDARSELEQISREQEIDSKNYERELDIWMQKKLDLESQIQKETLRGLGLNENLKRLGEKTKASEARDPKGEKVLLSLLDQATEWVESSLPFRREARLSELKNLKDRLASGLEDSTSISSALWQFYENEIKMARTNEFRNIDANETVRLGLVGLYTKNTDGTVAKIAWSKGQWDKTNLTGSDKEGVLRLIQAMKGKRKSGYFELPTENGVAL